MNVDPSKIKALIEYHGRRNNYDAKSFVIQFTRDFKLNYNQWSAYCNGNQNIGIKVIQQLMDIFPNLNLNWLLKNEEEMMSFGENPATLREPDHKYENITNEILYKKLEEIHSDLKILR